MIICTPAVKVIVIIRVVQPGTGTLPIHQSCKTIAPYTNEANANIKPSADTILIGKYENPTNESMANLNFFESVHFDVPFSRFVLL